MFLIMSGVLRKVEVIRELKDKTGNVFADVKFIPLFTGDNYEHIGKNTLVHPNRMSKTKVGAERAWQSYKNGDFGN